MSISKSNEKKAMGLSIKIVAPAVLAIVAAVAVNYVVFVRGYAKDARASLMEKAAAFTAVADETKNHASRLQSEKAFDGESLLAEALEEVSHGKGYDQTRFYETIPVVVGWTAAGKAAEREHIDFKVAAFEARNPKNEPASGTFRAEMLRDLEAQARSGGEMSLGRIDEKTNTLHYMRAIKLDESCMLCHGDPARYDERDANGKFDGKDPLGFAMEGWKPGDTHGAYEVSMPLATADAHVAGFITNGLWVTVPTIAVAAFGFVFALRRMVTRPLNGLIERIKDVATGDGDLTQRINLNRGDEIGRLAHWFDTFVGTLHGLIRSVADSTNSVAAAATEIAASAEEMAAGLTEQERQTSQVSAAVEEMAASATEVAQKSEATSKAAGDSRHQAEEGGRIVQDTVEEMKMISGEVTSSADSVLDLGKKSEQIGAIIGVINEIADQTNLLALNAAIEAARAGEHGRGFAVVADEVRKLAERTTKATEEVAQSIKEIQNGTGEAVQQIQAGSGRVSKGVDLVNSAGGALAKILDGSRNVVEMVSSIAAAATEQSAATEEIARSVQQISAVTRESNQGANQAAQAAQNLSQNAEQLRAIVGKFKV
ncbi:MAG: methyl-accepting chemotaxis protein [Phycisphaerales bacterium]|nr:MAG: methyl-accepting chemotaxis protein [Phycisphaerales bacterium]